MYLSLHFCLISLLSIVPGTHAQFVTVCPATAKLSEDATMMFTFTPGVGVTPATVAAVTWFKSDGSGKQRDSLITNLGGNSQPNGRYSLNSNGYLIISNVTKEDTGYYLCQVFTSAGDSSRNNFSTLTVYYLETPTLEPSNTNVNETETAIFTCLFLDGLPMPITITWFKDGSVRDFSNTEKYPQSDATLQISNVNKMDGGDYQCRAENAAYSGDEGKLSNTGTLSVVFLLDDVLIYISSYTAAKNVTITCSANSSPYIMVNLSKDGNVIKTESDSLLTYKIDSVTENDGGSYKCTATNREISKESKTKVLNYYPPEYVDYITVAPGEIATIAPNILGNPNEFIYQWSTDPPGIGGIGTDPTTFIFKASDDVGTNYTVTVNATNNIGSATISFQVTVSSVDYCVSNPCGNKGTCTSANFDFTCECEQGYSGRYCENSVYGPILTIGMLFVGIIFGAFGVIGGLIGYTRIKQKAQVDRRSTDQRLQDPYMDYVADNTTAGNENQTYQDLQYREETAYVNAMLGKK